LSLALCLTKRMSPNVLKDFIWPNIALLLRKNSKQIVILCADKQLGWKVIILLNNIPHKFLLSFRNIIQIRSLAHRKLFGRPGHGAPTENLRKQKFTEYQLSERQAIPEPEHEEHRWTAANGMSNGEKDQQQGRTRAAAVTLLFSKPEKKSLRTKQTCIHTFT
jgi:hypothetical protein